MIRGVSQRFLPKVDVPEGASGNWAVQRFSVTKEDAMFFNLRAGIRGISPGHYTRLVCGATVVMSDTPAEVWDHIAPVANAHDDCLVNGLGLGMVANAMLLKDAVKSVTVIELNPHVISLVAPHYQEKFGDRFRVIQSDALLYKPPRGTRYGTVWHDIWNDICGDNLENMKLLHRKYGRRTDWQGSWCRSECQQQR